MKKLMLLALIASTSSVFAADAAADRKEAQAKAQELGHMFDAPENAAAKAKHAERAARKAAQPVAEDVINDAAGMFAEPANIGRDAKPVVTKLGRFGTFRRNHPYILFGGLTVAGLGLVGWMVNKFVVSKKEAKAEVAPATQNPALEAQQQAAAQFKPAKKA